MADRYSEFICYGPGCAKKTLFNLTEASRSAGIKLKCDYCSKEWVCSFIARTCCSVKLLFCSVESGEKKCIKKVQDFRLPKK